jgi:hypothetical protein
VAKTPPVTAVSFSVWSANGGPLADDAVRRLEDALEQEKLRLFNDGHRVLSQTTRARG